MLVADDVSDEKVTLIQVFQGFKLKRNSSQASNKDLLHLEGIQETKIGLKHTLKMQELKLNQGKLT